MSYTDNIALGRLFSRCIAPVCLLALAACFPEAIDPPEVVEHIPEPLPSLSCTAFIKSGYTDKQSYYPGEKMKVYFDTQGSSELCKLTLYSVTGDSVYSVASAMPASTALPPNPSEVGFGFPAAAEFILPELESGVYLVDNKIPFVVKTRKPVDLLVVYASNTANAYAQSGGKSLYSLDQRPPAVSFHRPISLEPFSTACLRWFTTLNDFTLGYMADVDMDTAENFDRARVVVIAGHSEYWTLAARRNFDRFVDAGGDALILSGNTMWWQVRYSEDKTQLICYKDVDADPISDPTLKTINWSEPLLGYSILSSIGADFTYGGYGLKSDAGWNGYRITSRNSPMFEGLDIPENFVLALPTAEYDGAPILGYDDNGYPILDEAALQFDKIELLGFDKGFRGQETVGTFIVFRKKPGAGIVVNTSSCDWCSGNGMGGRAGSMIKTITYNAMHKLLNDAEVFSE